MFEPAVKNACAFIDGQNLFLQSKEAFGYRFPNYDIGALALQVCKPNDWVLAEVRFYTGIHDPTANPFWNSFWVNKTTQMGQRG